METYSVRLKPYDASRGHVRRGITVASLGMSFEEGKVVTGVSDREAKVLRTIRQRHEVEDSPLAFDVMSDDDMKRTLATEAKTRLGLDPETLAAIREELSTEPQAVPAATTRTRRRPAAGAPA